MKAKLDTRALGGLFLALAVTTGPALAENGSERIDEYLQQQRQILQMREDSGEGFSRMVEAQPTASGYRNDEMGSDVRQPPKHQTWIYQQRLEYGK